MTDPTRPEPRPREPAARPPEAPRRWVGAVILAAFIVVPIGILVFSNLDTTEVSWAGFKLDQPLWAILIVTFVAGMLGGKLGGWGWRRWRRRRRRLKEELEILRKHGADPNDRNL